MKRLICLVVLLLSLYVNAQQWSARKRMIGIKNKTGRSAVIFCLALLSTNWKCGNRLRLILQP